MREAEGCRELPSDVNPRTMRQTRLAPATNVSPPPDPSDTEERERRRAVRMENLKIVELDETNSRQFQRKWPANRMEAEGGNRVPFQR